MFRSTLSKRYQLISGSTKQRTFPIADGARIHHALLIYIRPGRGDTFRKPSGGINKMPVESYAMEKWSITIQPLSRWNWFSFVAAGEVFAPVCLTLIICSHERFSTRWGGEDLEKGVSWSIHTEELETERLHWHCPTSTNSMSLLRGFWVHN